MFEINNGDEQGEQKHPLALFVGDDPVAQHRLRAALHEYFEGNVVLKVFLSPEPPTADAPEGQL
jgi:hypothetical protein